MQETHLNAQHRFGIRGYQSFKLDREGYKGGVLTLVRNGISAKQTEVTTGSAGAAEIIGVLITCDEMQILLYNLYCPSDISLSLDAMIINDTACMVVCDFNSHSERWGYLEMNSRGAEVEDWEIENNLFLINAPDDPPTCYSRR
uniref:Endonuclease/exonuclease/phosphatase domain-containing protein n=2 Tax=Arion vulgaris TaxID=1028688 RepID=A0A0B7BD04_9EUPU